MWCKGKTTYVCSTCIPLTGLCASTAATGCKDCFIQYHKEHFPDHIAFPHTGKR